MGALIGLYVLFLAVFTTGACGDIALEKNRGAWRWFFAGLLFGPVALIAIGFMEKNPPKRKESP